jgi:hypothetical protein
MVDVTLPPGERDENWLLFHGLAKLLLPEFVLLRPRQEYLQIRMHIRDVLMLADLSEPDASCILVRRGSRFLELQVLNAQLYESLRRSQERGSEACPAGSECIDGVEFCCGDNTARNACYGRWRC